MALAAIPEAIVTIQTPAPSRADVCGDVGGRHVDVGGCADPAATVEEVPPSPEDVPPPPTAPDVTACADVGGRHVSVGGCT